MADSHIGKTVGILGGGQLGKMMTSSAHKLGIKVCVLDPTPDCPCSGFVDKHIVGSFNDSQQVLKMKDEGCDVVTVETEHVNVDSLEQLEKSGILVYPSSGTLRLIQDKFLQHQFLRDNGLKVTEFMAVDSIQDLYVAIQTFGIPLLLKSRRLSYDGRGNCVIKSKDEAETGFTKLGGKDLYAEKYVNFVKELSVMVVYHSQDNILTYPVVETIHGDNICHFVLAPASVSETSRTEALNLAKQTVKSFKTKGIFGIEMFLQGDGSVLVNEVAPRPHNSGHFTIEACVTCQFESHLRSILSLPKGDPSMKVPCAIMVNILGKETKEKTIEPIHKALGIQGASVHWYGKSKFVPQRKMGHVTFVGKSWDHVNKQVIELDVGYLKDAERFKEAKPDVAIIMGSDSDLPVMKDAAIILRDFGVPFELTIVSAHRTPDRMFSYAKAAHTRGIKIIIAGAGGAAHLPGMVAALTPLPVIGVPVSLKVLDGNDSLLSIVQMPRGVPVATVAINNSTNAGLLAVRILGCENRSLLEKLMEYQEMSANSVLDKAKKLEDAGW